MNSPPPRPTTHMKSPQPLRLPDVDNIADHDLLAYGTPEARSRSTTDCDDDMRSISSGGSTPWSRSASAFSMLGPLPLPSLSFSLPSKMQACGSPGGSTSCSTTHGDDGMSSPCSDVSEPLSRSRDSAASLLSMEEEPAQEEEEIVQMRTEMEAQINALEEQVRELTRQLKKHPLTEVSTSSSTAKIHDFSASNLTTTTSATTTFQSTTVGQVADINFARFVKPFSRKGPFMVFCSHTKGSHAWDGEEFVQNHIWEYLGKNHISVFYDRYCLPAQAIKSCLEEASRVKVMLVVLDRASPTNWMVREIRMALKHGIKVQTILRQDKFSWEEVGRDLWKKKRVDDDVINGAFELPAIEFNCKPIYLDAARAELMYVMKNLLSV